MFYVYILISILYVLVDRQVGREGERENSNKTVLPTSSKIIDTAQQPFNRLFKIGFVNNRF